ncbi:MAG: AmmeMemoRadiSam system protein A [Casimicrobiaceae bacterium]
MDDPVLGRALLRYARAAIARELRRPFSATDFDVPRLDAPGATFVTLKLDDDLRGCVGTLEPVRLLRADVEHNARDAAFADPRFPPLAAHEFDRVVIEVSLLSATVPLSCRDVDDLCAQLRPGVDGLVLRHGAHRGTFLPQVWEALPDPRAFVRELERKAGLAPDAWDDDVIVERYTVSKWSEGACERDRGGVGAVAERAGAGVPHTRSPGSWP